MNRQITSQTMALVALAIGGASFLTTTQAGDAVHWDYSGHAGPAHWGELDPAFGVCQSGTAQTPIDIVSRTKVALPPIEFHYRTGGQAEIHNGHTIQVDYREGSSITLDGREYWLKQFHFHAPSENHIGGKEYPMEAHLVHADAEGHLAVIAVMFEEGAENLALANPWAAMPQRAGERVALRMPASAEALLPADHAYYRFEGSLTTPPCTEGVTWLVMKHPVTASHGQLTKFARAIGHPNNRPLQALNTRTVLE
jgi:carbonic anhydrase